MVKSQTMQPGVPSPDTPALTLKVIK